MTKRNGKRRLQCYVPNDIFNKVEEYITSNEDIANSKKNIKISCKVKDLGTAWRDDNINETKVNYVKFS